MAKKLGGRGPCRSGSRDYARSPPCPRSFPTIPVGANLRTLRGRADNMPSPGIHLGLPAPLAPPYPVVAAYPTRAEVAQLLKETSWTSAADLILLDADQPDGYVRNWAPPGFPPLRHIGYALQWFGLALALGVIYVVTNFRRTPKGPT